MGLRIYKLEEYSYTHENQQFRELCNILKKKFANTEGHYLLFANINFSGVAIDALFVKNNAIVVLEFKNYGGKVTADENGDWKLEDGTIVKGGYGKNPFCQTKNNKWNTIRTLNLWYPKSYTNVHHTSGVVVFNQPVEVNDSHISAKAKTWFHISDMRAIGDLLDDIVSPEINYTNADLDYLPILFNCADKLVDEAGLSTMTVEESVSAPVVNPNDLFAVTQEVLEENGFSIKYKQIIPAREACFHEEGLQGFSEATRNYANTKYNGQLFVHQYDAVNEAKQGHNVCLATSTSSGKTAIFHMCALEIFANDPNAKILAIYPMKALGRQQQEAWENLGDNIKCGRIDGNVTSKSKRLETMRTCQVITMTPDVVHTFLLGKLKDADCATPIKNFLKGLKMVVIDELHLYKGILGSNSAYLFRRLNSCMTMLGAQVPQYITASATIDDPKGHSKNITGAKDDFVLIDKDASPTCETNVIMTIPSGTNDLSRLLVELANKIPESKSITFFDSRKAVASTYQQVNDIIEEAKDDDKIFLPFLAGQEKEDADKIYAALRDGRFRGVVSTSSTEVGIDIKGLNIAILYGVPTSTTSLFQRMGRVGRYGSNKAVVIIVNDGRTVNALRLARDPHVLFSLPMEEPALYMDNEYLLNIQALHFVGDGGQEFFSVGGNEQNYDGVEDFFPKEFNIICKDVLSGQQSINYANNAAYGNDYSQYAYPLRAFGREYQAEHWQNRNKVEGCGRMTEQQMLNEAFPGAVYKYKDDCYRVTKVNRKDRKIILKQENKKRFFSTVPLMHKTVEAQKKETPIYEHRAYGQLDVINNRLIEFKTIEGYKEIRGNNEETFDYPCDYYKQDKFTCQLDTNGVLLMHPALTRKGVERGLIGMLLYNCFLSDYAFDRADVDYHYGKTKGDMEDVPAFTPFITIYDRNNGGLNISSKMLEHDVLLKGFTLMKEMLKSDYIADIIGKALSPASMQAIDDILEDLKENEGTLVLHDSEHYCIAEKSKALYAEGEDEPVEVTIDRAYYDSATKTYNYDIVLPDGTVVEEVSEDLIAPIPGVSMKAKVNEEGRRVRPTNELW